MKESNIDPGPKLGYGTWARLLTIHVETLWQCDLVSKPMWRAKGLLDLYLLVFLHFGTQSVWICPCTVHPDLAWVSQQAKNFLIVADDMGLTPMYALRDNDTKYTSQFDEVLESSGAELKRNTPLSPSLRAHVERFIKTLRFECIENFVIVAEWHLNDICRVWCSHHSEEQPHSAGDHLPPAFVSRPDDCQAVRRNEIVCTSRLGGMIHSYSRRAA